MMVVQMYDFNVSDIMFQNNCIYISNALHDYFLNNFMFAFVAGLTLGVMLGITADSLNQLIRSKL